MHSALHHPCCSVSPPATYFTQSNCSFLHRLFYMAASSCPDDLKSPQYKRPSKHRAPRSVLFTCPEQYSKAKAA